MNFLEIFGLFSLIGYVVGFGFFGFKSLYNKKKSSKVDINNKKEL